MDKIHITAAYKAMESGKPFQVTIWTKGGRLETLDNCVSLQNFRYTGTRRIKLMKSRQIRQIRDICIMRLNGYEVII